MRGTREVFVHNLDLNATCCVHTSYFGIQRALAEAYAIEEENKR